MKEMDFLPSWYKQNRRKNIGYKWQYAVIAAGFVFMVCWSFFTAQMTNVSTAENVPADDVQQDGNSKLEIYQDKIDELKKQIDVIKRCGSNIVLSAVVAELSEVISENVILNKIEVVAEEYKVKSTTGNRSVVRRSSSKKDFKKDYIYKFVVNGVAVNNKSVAQLLCDLEASQYFNNVIAGYSKEVKLKENMMSEFEITFDLANYREIRK